ncbi:MAG: hypothetical protein IJI25_01540 [Eubacterium sp.]|nr:hypothetical protein [Eubacterium sp.]
MGLSGNSFSENNEINRVKQSNAVQKIRSSKGESIGETLVALLISTLALTMLAGAITTTSNIVKNSREHLGRYYLKNEDDNGVVKMTGADDTKKIQITITESGGLGISEDVYYYQNGEFGSKKTVTSYKLKK